MESTLQPLLRAGAYGLLDNARIHKTPEALASIEIVLSHFRALPTRAASLSNWLVRNKYGKRLNVGTVN